MQNDNERFGEAVDAIAKSVDYMLKQNALGQTKIYIGILTNENNGVYSVRVNGETYTIPQYGNFTHGVNEAVKVFVPQGNMNLAFFI